MGLFKQMKDMKNVINAAPDMIDQAQQLQAQAMEMQASQMAAAQAQADAAVASSDAALAMGGADFEPIEGVSLEQYATISKELGAAGGDQSQAASIAMSHGIAPDKWQAAMTGWNARMGTNPAVGQQFNKLYTGR